MMSYTCLSDLENTMPMQPYRIAPIRHEDILLIKKWRNEQMAILRQNHVLSDKEQLDYYNCEILPTFSQAEPAQLLFSFLYEDRCIGYGGLTHIDWQARRAEVSFLLETERNRHIAQFQKEFSLFLSFLEQIAFQKLGLHRLYTETYDIRPYFVHVLEDHGFLFEGRLRDHVNIENRYVDALLHAKIAE